jgi:hypothetical protein
MSDCTYRNGSTNEPYKSTLRLEPTDLHHCNCECSLRQALLDVGGDTNHVESVSHVVRKNKNPTGDRTHEGIVQSYAYYLKDVGIYRPPGPGVGRCRVRAAHRAQPLRYLPNGSTHVSGFGFSDKRGVNNRGRDLKGSPMLSPTCCRTSWSAGRQRYKRQQILTLKAA